MAEPSLQIVNKADVWLPPWDGAASAANTGPSPVFDALPATLPLQGDERDPRPLLRLRAAPVRSPIWCLDGEVVGVDAQPSMIEARTRVRSAQPDVRAGCRAAPRRSCCPT